MMFHVSPNVHFPEDYLGIIPSMIQGEGPLRDQLDAGYQHGGGWRPFDKFTMSPDGTLNYPGEEPLPVRVWTVVREEQLLFYDYSWVAIRQLDGTFEVGRMS